MTNHFDQQVCERFGPLISAKIDDELQFELARELDQHLQACAVCRGRMESFGKINGLVFSASFPGAAAASAPARAEQRLPADSCRQAPGRWVPLALAAAVLLGLLATALPSGPKATAEQIARPIAELEWINDEQQRGQVRMLKTIQLELRALKLELANLNSDADTNDALRTDKQGVEEKLERLIDKVNQCFIEQPF